MRVMRQFLKEAKPLDSIHADKKPEAKDFSSTLRNFDQSNHILDKPSPFDRKKHL
jgi:hypothetical protein